MTNSGAIPLAISKVAITGPFAETNNCGTGLGPGPQSCGINVTFTPTAAGAATGTLTITDSASDSPQTVALTGGNAGLGLSVASGGSASATVSAGQTATYSLSIGGQGVAGTATFTCTGAPTGATCNVPASTPFSATTASKISVSVTTTAHSGALPFHFPQMTWLWALAALGCLTAWRLVIWPIFSAPSLELGPTVCSCTLRLRRRFERQQLCGRHPGRQLYARRNRQVWLDDANPKPDALSQLGSSRSAAFSTLPLPGSAACLEFDLP